MFGDYKKSWEFTKAREWKEGRNIVKEKFIEQYFNSLENVKRIKEKFKDNIRIDLILKKEDNDIEKIYFNIDLNRLEKVLEERYTISNINNQIIEDNIK